MSPASLSPRHDEAVLGPSGMSTSTYEQPLPAGPRGTDRVGILRRPVRGFRKWHVYPEMAAAGLWTTPTDLARSAIEVQQSRPAIQQGHLPGDDAPAAHRQMNDYGLGLALTGSGAARTFVTTAGMRASMR